MRKIIFILLLFIVLNCPVYAVSFVNDDIPNEAETYIADGSSNFWEDLWQIVTKAVKELRPDLTEAAKICLKLIAVNIFGSILYYYATDVKFVAKLVITIATGLLLLDPGHSLMTLGKNTVQEITEYGKILLPVLTGSLAAQGAATTSAALYAGTALFSALLNTVVSSILIPIVYLYLCICIANSVLDEEVLKRFRDAIKWLLTWSLKTILYLFTGYMTITGVISGTVDASALKATKLAISGAVPVVGNILSDASETILLSASLMKSSVGAYGLVVLISLLIGPFLRIGVHYVLMKFTAVACAVFTGKELKGFVEDYSSAMGYILAMTGVACVLLMVGIVCFMKGVG